jgi:signal transduction histidine kinase
MVSASAAHASARDASATHLRGRPLALARAAWLVVALLALAIFVVATPLFFNQFQTACPTPTCATEQLTTDQLRATHAAGWSLPFFAAALSALRIAHALLWCTVGILIFWRKSDDWMALFVALFLILFGLLNATPPPIHPLIDGVGMVLGDLAWVLLYAFFCLFPNGRFVPRWMWLPLVVVLLAQVPASLPPDSPYAVNNWSPWILTPLLFGQFGCALYAQIYRYRHVSDPVERQQTKWAVFGIATSLSGFIIVNLLFTLVPTIFQPPAFHYLVMAALSALALLLIPLSLAMAVLRSRLWGIDVVINRTLVYTALTACVIGMYVLIVGYLGALFRTGGNLPISLVATGIVAVLFQPLRERLQRGINHLLYGERDEPYAVVARLGQRLGGTLAPEAVLPTLVETVAQALKLPYAAVLLKHGEAFVTATEYPEKRTSRSGVQETNEASPFSQSPDLLVSLALTYQGEVVGKLLVAPRAAGEDFAPADRRLLSILAQQAGVAAHTVQLTTDLQQSRERLITAREEERRRLRRDLHDGVGPTLASMAQRIDAATYIVRDDPDEAITLLQGLKGQVRATLADIRRLVYALRPPALDEFGLLVAIREYAAQVAGANLHVVVEAPEALPPLPAAVELAAYRIGLEALTNVTRHSQATTCSVRLMVIGVGNRQALSVEIRDDGAGLPAEHRAGVGLTSMRERAAELGGVCTIDAPTGSGTRVCAWLPLS